MTFYLTCRACQFASGSCATRDSFAATIKPLGITSVKWRCADRQPLYPPGSPCFAKTVPSQYPSQTDTEPPMLWFPGIVCKQRAATSFIVFIAPGTLPIGEEIGHQDDWPFDPTNRGYCKIPLHRLRPRAGEIVPVCRHGTPRGMKCDVVDCFGVIEPITPESVW